MSRTTLIFSIMLTCLCNLDLLKPHFCMVELRRLGKIKEKIQFFTWNDHFTAFEIAAIVRKACLRYEQSLVLCDDRVFCYCFLFSFDNLFWYYFKRTYSTSCEGLHTFRGLHGFSIRYHGNTICCHFSSPNPKANRWPYSILLLRRPSTFPKILFETALPNKPNFTWSLHG